MKFLVILTPSAGHTLDDFAPYLVEEEQVVWSAYRAGRLREFYFQSTPPVISLVYEAAEEATVHAELDLLPMVKAGLLDRRILLLGPWLPLEVAFDKALMVCA